jgi:UDP-3-O-[3-hydroxymyristoyl] glucosamine N-acyltransferase
MDGFMKGCIHPSAIISEDAKIGQRVTVGANVIIYDNVTLGDDTVVGPNSILGEPTAGYYSTSDYQNPPLHIGRNSLIRSEAIIYAGSIIGDNFECGHRVTIREQTTIRDHCRVGTLCDIQGHCQIGHHTRLHSNVHIGQQSVVGNFVWIFPYTVLTNDPHPPSNVLVGATVEDYAVIATSVVIMAGVTVGKHALVGAMAMVRSDVQPETVVVGNPAKQVTTVKAIRSKLTGEPVYPWPEHFERGMPWAGIGYAAWQRLCESEESPEP